MSGKLLWANIQSRRKRLLELSDEQYELTKSNKEDIEALRELDKDKVRFKSRYNKEFLYSEIRITKYIGRLNDGGNNNYIIPYASDEIVYLGNEVKLSDGKMVLSICDFEGQHRGVSKYIHHNGTFRGYLYEVEYEILSPPKDYDEYLENLRGDTLVESDKESYYEAIKHKI